MPFALPAHHLHAPRRTTARWVSAVVLVAGLAVGGGHGAYADDPVPSEGDVAAAQERAAEKGRDVAAVQADLIRADLALTTAGDHAAQAAEAWNGARWRAEQARADAVEAEEAAASTAPGEQTALMAVARTGNLEAAELLLEHGANVNAAEGWGGQTALMWASARNQPAMVDLGTLGAELLEILGGDQRGGFDDVRFH